MNESLYRWYANSIKHLHKFQEEAVYGDLEAVEKCKELFNALEIIISACPSLKERYDKEIAFHKSFTNEQVGFICFQIGEWYIEWKHKMWIDDKPNQHWLGLAKEQLKTMICGE